MQKFLAALLAIFVLSGCGTIAARVRDTAPDVKVYPAATADAVLFYLACCTGFIHMEGKQSLGTTVAFRTVVPILAIVDTPISLVTDTIFLPYDLYVWSSDSNDVELSDKTVKADDN